MNFRGILTRLILPLTWRTSRRHAAKVLRRFSEVEFDSAWQYLNAMTCIQEPKIQLMLFENVLEEMSHADAFADVAHMLADQQSHDVQESRTVMVKDASGIPYFLACAHESERAICVQFDGFARASRRIPEVSSVFRSISIDEQKHEREARLSLEVLIGDKRRAASLVAKARNKRIYQSFLRASQRFGDLVFAFCFGLVYFSFGPLLRHYCKRLLATRPAPVSDQGLSAHHVRGS